MTQSDTSRQRDMYVDIYKTQQFHLESSLFTVFCCLKYKYSEQKKKHNTKIWHEYPMLFNLKDLYFSLKVLPLAN